jgi:hypothetical protein
MAMTYICQSLLSSLSFELWPWPTSVSHCYHVSYGHDLRLSVIVVIVIIWVMAMTYFCQSLLSCELWPWLTSVSRCCHCYHVSYGHDLRLSVIVVIVIMWVMAMTYICQSLLSCELWPWPTSVSHCYHVSYGHDLHLSVVVVIVIILIISSKTTEPIFLFFSDELFDNLRCRKYKSKWLVFMQIMYPRSSTKIPHLVKKKRLCQFLYLIG